jgi:hypothetical protein
MPEPRRKPSPLAQAERDRRAYRQLKKTATRRNAPALERGRALKAISSKRLHLLEYASFTEFCRVGCGLSRAQANRLIKAADMWEMRRRFDDLPRNIKLLCRLATVPPGLRAGVWKDVLAEAAAARTKPSCALLERIIQRTTKTKANRRRVAAAELDRIAQFFAEGTPAGVALGPRQMRLAMITGLETLEGLIADSDQESAAIIEKLQRIARKLFPSILY